MSRDITMVGVAGAVAVGLTAAKALLPNPTDHWAPSQIETARPKNRQTLSIWSGWRDLNPRPLRPEARQALAMTAIARRICRNCRRRRTRQFVRVRFGCHSDRHALRLLPSMRPMHLQGGF
jgi:hypothetical protein